MAPEAITIQTADGQCPAYVFTPPAPGRYPGVLLFMDGFGIRPTLFHMAQRMAGGGFVVLLPDLFYRIGSYPAIDVPKVFQSPDVRKAVEGLIGKPTNPALALKDTASLVEYMSHRSDVAGPHLGAVGYCMGGAIALGAAGLYPDSIAAAASFHGGNLAIDSDVSPHRLATKMKASVYVAAAEKDTSYPPEMALLLEQALQAAGVEHRCETYLGAVHGWTMPDTPRFNADATERHWRELFAFFRETLIKPEQGNDFRP